MEYRQLSESEYRDLESRILYEDNHLFIVHKLIGEIIQSDITGDECLVDSYKAYIAQRDNKAGKVFLAAAHRLDRPVSGICIFAKTSKSLARLAEMFQSGAVHKKYRALCCAAPKQKEGLLEDYLKRNPKQNKSYVTSNPIDAKLARLRYSHITSTERYHLLEVTLLTGRHHQIRCQLAHIGCVIKGDLKYGAPRSNPDGGICLQSFDIEFDHPVKHIPIHITIPPPSDWKGI